MKKILPAVLVLFFCCYASEAADLTVEEIVQKRDDLMRGESSFGQYEMIVTPKDTEKGLVEYTRPFSVSFGVTKGYAISHSTLISSRSCRISLFHSP